MGGDLGYGNSRSGSSKVAELSSPVDQVTGHSLAESNSGLAGRVPPADAQFTPDAPRTNNQEQTTKNEEPRTKNLFPTALISLKRSQCSYDRSKNSRKHLSVAALT